MIEFKKNKVNIKMDLFQNNTQFNHKMNLNQFLIKSNEIFKNENFNLEVIQNQVNKIFLKNLRNVIKIYQNFIFKWIIQL